MEFAQHRCESCGKELPHQSAVCPICDKVLRENESPPQWIPPPQTPEPIGAYIDGKYVPNTVPLIARIWNIVLSVLLMSYGTYGLWRGDLYIPGKRTEGIHLHGFSAWVMYGAFLGASLNMLSVVVDHYDKRENEAQYRRFARNCKIIGWSLFVLSFILSFDRKY